MPPITNAHTHPELSDLAHLCPAEPRPLFTWLRRLAWTLVAPPDPAMRILFILQILLILSQKRTNAAL